MLITVKGPAFVARLSVDGDVVIDADPLLTWMVGWISAEVADYCERHGWTRTLEGETGFEPSPLWRSVYDSLG